MKCGQPRHCVCIKMFTCIFFFVAPFIIIKSIPIKTFCLFSVYACLTAVDIQGFTPGRFRRITSFPTRLISARETRSPRQSTIALKTHLTHPSAPRLHRKSVKVLAWFLGRLPSIQDWPSATHRQFQNPKHSRQWIHARLHQQYMGIQRKKS